MLETSISAAALVMLRLFLSLQLEQETSQTAPACYTVYVAIPAKNIPQIAPVANFACHEHNITISKDVDFVSNLCKW
jgi:hypothetical protein